MFSQLLVGGGKKIRSLRESPTSQQAWGQPGLHEDNCSKPIFTTLQEWVINLSLHSLANIHYCQPAFWIRAVLTGVQWYLADLIFVSLMTNDYGVSFHLLTCLPNVFSGEASVQVLLPLLIALFVFLLLSFQMSSCTWDVCPLSHLSFANISPSWALNFHPPQM